jgi:hypothetical protein
MAHILQKKTGGGGAAKKQAGAMADAGTRTHRALRYFQRTRIMKLKSLALTATVAAAALTAGLAQAATVSLTNILATWYGGAPAANVTYLGNGTAAPQARWGIPADTFQSGYNFVVDNDPLNFLVPPSPSLTQVIGTFTHLNNPIAAGTSITGINLRITADVAVDGTPVAGGNVEFNTNFTHNETPNGASPCADGGVNGVGVNVNGCADLVTANFSPLSESFLIGADSYTLKVLGFSLTADGLNPFTSFWTTEVADNHAFLLANVERTTVPEPGSLALLGLGLVGLVTMRRGKQSDRV